MREQYYILFKKWYLKRFIKTYRVKGINKKELKRSLYDHPQLTDEQKDNFWESVLMG